MQDAADSRYIERSERCVAGVAAGHSDRYDGEAYGLYQYGAR